MHSRATLPPGATRAAARARRAPLAGGIARDDARGRARRRVGACRRPAGYAHDLGISLACPAVG